jgi:hypothetical protein
MYSFIIICYNFTRLNYITSNPLVLDNQETTSIYLKYGRITLYIVGNKFHSQLRCKKSFMCCPYYYILKSYFDILFISHRIQNLI